MTAFTLCFLRMFCVIFAVINAHLKRMASPSLFGADTERLSFHAEMQTNNRLRFKVDRWTQVLLFSSEDRTEQLFLFFQIFDSQSQRFEVPHEHIPTVSSDPSSPITDSLEITQKNFGLRVKRRENKKVL